MNIGKVAVLFTLLAAAPAWAQIDIQETIRKAQEDMVSAQIDIQSMQSGFPFQPRIGGRSDAGYDAGARALDDHNYEEAARRFDSVIDSKSPRADGALYWKAYALNRLGRRDDALAALATLRRDYPASHWLSDAQALEAELKQGSGQAASPAQESNEDLKLMAINSLMSADPERAMPLLEGLLKGNSAPKVKDRALFVLTQSRSARAQQILSEYAKGAGNPDLQIRAIRYIGMSRAADGQQQLAGIYSNSNDVAVKREIIRALMVPKSRDLLVNLAKNEKDEDLRADLIRELGALHATDQLIQIYSADSNPKSKKVVLEGLILNGDAKPLIDLARKEPDPTLKKYMVQRLSMMHSKEATDYMLELLK